MSVNDMLRQLPSVDKLLIEASGLVEQEGRERVINALRQSLDAARDAIRAGGDLPSSVKSSLQLAHHFNLQSPLVQSPLINATGVIIHTNLGRAPLSLAAQEAMLAAARDYTPLEFDMQTGERGRRGEAIEKLLCDLTGAEAALVVNNCAAATVLMLAATSAGKGVIVSRGQLVEIGGGFRVPEIMAQSGAKLIEVGTTNRTKPADYRREIETSPEAIGALLRVHSSNFKMIGFTEEAGIDELVQLAHAFRHSRAGRPGQRRADRHIAVRAEPRADAAGQRGGRRVDHRFQRRQAAGRPASRPHDRPARVDRALPAASAGARISRRQIHPGSVGRDIDALCARRSPARGAGHSHDGDDEARDCGKGGEACYWLLAIG